MAQVNINTSKTYVLTNDWSGPERALGSPSTTEVTMVDSDEIDNTNQWKFAETSRPGYYRLHTVEGGTSKALDVINDNGTDSKHVHMARTGNYSGQFWRLDSWGDGTLRLSNTFTGTGKHLDVYADTYGPHLAPGNCIGQHWTLKPYEPPPPPPAPPTSLRRAPVASSDLVRDLELETEVIDGVTYHTYTMSRPEEGQRQVQVHERWKKEKSLGSGSFGTVSLELCLLGPKEGKFRAVKKIEKVEGFDGPIDYSRELEAIAKFSHPRYVHCFVKSYGWWETSEAVFIAMEFVEKGDLQKYLTMPFSESEAKQIVSQLLEGLKFMHDHGFAHRDMKPQNVLVFKDRPSWWVKIADFGISKRVEDQERTALRTQIGTPAYIAPEVVGIFPLADLAVAETEARTYTLAVDIWALGMMTFRLLTATAAFTEVRDLSLYVTLGRRFPKERLLSRGISDSGVEFVEKALAASASQRPSARDLLASAWITGR
ncbi:Obscurin [Dactylella cylindrospora]|nr:Obscurin [Dactylella cylindrospora]